MRFFKLWLGGLGALSDPTTPSTLNPELGKWFFLALIVWWVALKGQRDSYWVVACLVNELRITLVSLKWVLQGPLLLG